MRQKKVLFVAFAASVCAAASAPSAHATGPEIRTVTIVLSPENAAVAVNGHPRQHPSGALELRGPLGAVFTVEAVASGGSIIERVAITDVGALPPRLVVPAAPPSAQPPSLTTLPDALNADECAQRTWWDSTGVKHYKAQCLGFDDPWRPPPPRPAPLGRLGGLTIICVPKCDRISDNGTDLGPGHIFNRAVATGTHSLALSAPNGVKKTLVVDVIADQTRELRVTMDANQPKVANDVLLAALQPPSEDRRAPAPNDSTEEGYLTLASYPWTKVSEGGRALCLTPCVKVPLTPGIHLLVLENESATVKQSASVTIRSGEVTVKRFAFK